MAVTLLKLLSRRIPLMPKRLKCNLEEQREEMQVCSGVWNWHFVVHLVGLLRTSTPKQMKTPDPWKLRLERLGASWARGNVLAHGRG